MKNLKKVLSLALAFAMVLGLCIGAMAAQDVTDLADWADVTNKDAAQLLNAFNIMAGDDRGFRPTDNVTRAEAAKMISVALWGGDDLKDWFKDSTTTFTDVHSTDWFAGYVNYAATTGIVGGRNATTFDPKGNVTGYELLKMTLTALGYDQNKEGLVGANWKVNTMLLAIGSRGQKDLTKDVKVTNWDLAIDRDNTAKVIANMVERTPVTYNPTTGLVGNIPGKDADDVVTFGTYYLGLARTEGTLVANAYGAMTYGSNTAYAVKDSTKYNAVVLPKDGAPADAFDVNSDSGLFELGSKVVVYKKDGTPISVAVTPATAISDTDKYDTNTEGAKDVTSVTIGTATVPAYSADFNLDTDASGKYDLTITVKFSAISDVYDVVETENFGTVYQTNAAAAWRDLYDKPNTNIHTGFTTMKTIAGTAPAKGDKIMYAESTDAAGTPVNVGVALETVEGSVSRINGNDYYINGTKYSIGAGDKPTFGATGVFYTYPGSTIILDEDLTAKSDGKVALLYDAGLTPGNKGTSLGATATNSVVTVAAILPDGTPGNYVVTKFGNHDLTKDAEISTVFNTQSQNLFGLNGNDWSAASNSKSGLTLNNAKGGDTNYIVKYTLDENDNMTITEAVPYNGTIAGGNDGLDIKATTTNVTVTGGTAAGVKLITSDTVTFVQTKKDETTGAEEWAAYTGRHAYTIAKQGSVSVVLGIYNGIENASVKYAVVTKAALGEAAPTESDFYYVITVNGQIADDKREFVVYDASADEVKTVTTSLTGGANVKKGDFYGGYDGLTFSEPKVFTDDNKGYVTSVADNILVLSGFAKNAQENGYKDYGTLKAIVVDTDTKYYVLGDETNSEKITAADVIAQTPANLPKDDDQAPPYQAIVVVGTDNIADTVILFVEEQPAVAKAAE